MPRVTPKPRLDFQGSPDGDCDDGFGLFPGRGGLNGYRRRGSAASSSSVDRRDRLAECLRGLADAEVALQGVRGTLTDLVRDEESSSLGNPSSDCVSQPGERGSVLTWAPRGRRHHFQTFTDALGKAPTCGNNHKNHHDDLDSVAPVILLGDKWLDPEIPLPSADSGGDSIGEEVTKSSAPDKSKDGKDCLYQTPVVDQAVLDRLYPKNDSPSRLSQRRAALSWVKWPSEAGEVEEKNEVEPYEARNEAIKIIYLSPICWGLIPIPVLHPEGRVRLFWMSLGAIFIIYEAFMVPFYLCFDTRSAGVGAYFSFIIMVYFIVDLPVQFLTGLRDHRGFLVMKPKKLGLRYLRTWFLGDFIASLPWDLLSTEGNGSGYSVMFKVVRLLRMIRLFRLLKMEFLTDKLVMFIEANQVSMFVTSVLRVLLMLFTITHWAACLWYLIGSRDIDGPTWVRNWQTKNLQEPDIPFWYLLSLYFTLTTMTTVGFGDIVPTNIGEVLFTLVLLLCASLVFAGLMGTLTDLITSLNSRSHARSEEKSMLARYMRWRAVPPKLTSDIRQHFLFMWETNEGYDVYEQAVKAQLPPVLQSELCYHIYGQILRNAPFLTWVRGQSACVKRLAAGVKSLFMERGDHIFRRGEPNVQIYVLISGTVWLTQNVSLLQGEEARSKAESAVSMFYEIPRRKETGLVTAGLSVVEGATQSARKVIFRRKLTQQEMASKVLKVLAGRIKLTLPWQADEDEVEQMDVMKRASARLQHQDARESIAARILQRFWRRCLEKSGHFAAVRSPRRSHTVRLAAPPSPFLTEPPARPSRSSSFDWRGCKDVARSLLGMQSKLVEAPAYFGESCLWVPFDLWDLDPLPKYMYSARCRTRVELVMIPRHTVQEMLEAFSPWLPMRLERFQKAVAEAFAAVPAALAMGAPTSPGLPSEDMSAPSPRLSLRQGSWSTGSGHCSTKS